jgi:tetratricopeptide (TPR) repeat protein
MSRGRLAPAAAALLLLVAAVYGQTAGHRFLNYDDGTYVVRNPLVNGGFTVAGVLGAWRPAAANWHPLTWLSHMLDVQLFGLRPAGHHLVSVAIHGANAVLLLALLRALTGALAPAFVVAGLFAVHPLHVESVAWVAERKDVLSALFVLLAMAAHLRARRRPGAPWPVAVAGLGALAMAAKPMAVTLPLLLLCLDFWPLGRFRALPGGPSPLPRLALEKAPLLLLAAADGAATLYAQHVGREAWVAPSLALRAGNALVSCATYLARAVWPVRLAPLYPYPTAGIPWYEVAASAAALAALSAWAWRARRSDPALLAGWLWYLIGLLPVLGLHQVGFQARADRYTYLPLVGVSFAAAWWAAPRVRGGLRATAAAATAAALLGLAAAAFVQTGYWRDSATLMGRTVAVTERNAVALNNLGTAIMDEKREREAIPLFLEALAIVPGYRNARFNHGSALFRLERYGEALEPFRQLADANRGDLEAAYYYGATLFRLGRYEEAGAVYERLLGAAPQDLESRYYLGLALLRLGRSADAERQFAAIVAARPDYLDARIQLAVARAGARATPPLTPRDGAK